MMTDIKNAKDARAEPRQWDIAADWWRDMQDRRANGEPNPRADRAARARLRRADGAMAVADPAVLTLYRALGGRGWNEARMKVALRLAQVLVHAREDDRAASFARSLGPKNFDEKDCVLSPLRMRALLQADGEEDLVRRFRRAVDLLNARVNVRDLARLLILWDQEQTRTRFAFDYFDAGAAAPVAAAQDISA